MDYFSTPPADEIHNLDCCWILLQGDNWIIALSPFRPIQQRLGKDHANLSSLAGHMCRWAIIIFHLSPARQTPTERTVWHNGRLVICLAASRKFAAAMIFIVFCDCDSQKQHSTMRGGLWCTHGLWTRQNRACFYLRKRWLIEVWPCPRRRVAKTFYILRANFIVLVY